MRQTRPGMLGHADLTAGREALQGNGEGRRCQWPQSSGVLVDRVAHLTTMESEPHHAVDM